jgi:hypothetical protein
VSESSAYGGHIGWCAQRLSSLPSSLLLIKNLHRVLVSCNVWNERLREPPTYRCVSSALPDMFHVPFRCAAPSSIAGVCCRTPSERARPANTIYLRAELTESTLTNTAKRLDYHSDRSKNSPGSLLRGMKPSHYVPACNLREIPARIMRTTSVYFLICVFTQCILLYQ